MPWFYGADENGDRNTDSYILAQFEAKSKRSAVSIHLGRSCQGSSS